MGKSSNSEVPSGVSGHPEAKKRPNPVVVERWYEHRRGTASPKYVRPCPLVQIIVYVVNVTVFPNNHQQQN